MLLAVSAAVFAVLLFLGRSLIAPDDVFTEQRGKGSPEAEALPGRAKLGKLPGYGCALPFECARRSISATASRINVAVVPQCPILQQLFHLTLPHPTFLFTAQKWFEAALENSIAILAIFFTVPVLLFAVLHPSSNLRFRHPETSVTPLRSVTFFLDPPSSSTIPSARFSFTLSDSNLPEYGLYLRNHDNKEKCHRQ